EQRREMLEHAGDEVIAERADAVASARIVHDRAPPRAVPETEVDVAAVARLIDERLWRERRVESVAIGDAAHGLAIEHLAIGRVERRRVADRKLLLSVAQLRVVLLDLDALRL